MKDIVIIGASGFGKEVAYYIKTINAVQPQFEIVGYIDDNNDLLGTEVIYGIKVVGNIGDLIDNRISATNIIIAIANNVVRKNIFDRLNDNIFFFPNIIAPTSNFDSSNKIGMGNIIAHHSMLTNNINIGDFNIFNGNIGIGHDVIIENFNLFGPRATIAGNVTIGSLNTFNMHSAVIQNRKIGNNNTINMSSVLCKNIQDFGTYFGIPAMKQKF